MKESIDRELLVRFVQGKTSTGETEQVKKFLLQPEWQEALDELLEEDFAVFEDVKPPEALSKDWNARFNERHVSPPRKLWPISRIGYAAACLILASALLYIFIPGNKASRPTIAMIERVNPKGTRSKITLPDSSIVYLGADSRIRFPENFSGNTRNVSLNGEAFFEVTKDPAHPFIIRSGSILTKVLGTSFKVSAFSGKNVTVSVATGKVGVSREITGQHSVQQLAVLTPGQEVIWNKSTSLATISEVDADAVRNWKNGEVTYIATSLAEVAEGLERVYNVRFQFKDKQIKNYHVSLIVKSTDQLTHTLSVICSTTHLQYSIKNGIVTLKKGG